MFIRNIYGAFSRSVFRGARFLSLLPTISQSSKNTNSAAEPTVSTNHQYSGVPDIIGASICIVFGMPSTSSKNKP